MVNYTTLGESKNMFYSFMLVMTGKKETVFTTYVSFIAL